MLEAELRGESFRKIDFNREVVALTGRSEGSVEYKFQNVSAALSQLGLVYVQGYKPMSNIQAALREFVIDHVNRHPEFFDLMTAIIDREPIGTVDLAWPMEASPVPDLELGVDFAGRRRLPRKIDYAQRESDNRALGKLGEEVVVELERKRLLRFDRPDLAAKVEHVAAERGDGLGYDVLSFTPEGRERFIEVKTTTRDEFAPFWLSRNEVEFSKEESDRFELHRLYKFEKKMGFYVLPGSLEESCSLKSETYTAVPKRSVS